MPVLNYDCNAIGEEIPEAQKCLRKTGYLQCSLCACWYFSKDKLGYGGQPEPLTMSNFAVEQKKKIVLTYLAAAADPC